MNNNTDQTVTITNCEIDGAGLDLSGSEIFEKLADMVRSRHLHGLRISFKVSDCVTPKSTKEEG